MKKRWYYFLAASVMGAFILVTHGAPPVAVIVGIACAAFLCWRKPSEV